ncbi:MAG: lipopolysaccharide kinase InaA family protein [gamma proteobacterium symbiont of Bathyaustriella thionipta]|nr:lipopolysaccharide kinase InaA family protein [gamma proteobacterium symbiont of Bathyaustriella thionipta]MCU7955114.1 lipopolysaccharide kinase InaA family protein [gamma proteobacterium symbiont of Bathyaustriella thionipta]MCU7967729.1 lipopolysaccharide kinase InaA family protein [gamma proteobacterium symbiont of Bathyaustriella thionipta]
MPKKIFWHIIPEYKHTALGDLFKDFDDAYRYEGEFITKSPLSQVYKVAIDGNYFYLKKYNISRKKIQRFLGQSKIQTEWQNLLWFQALNIPVAKVIAYGQETRGWITHRGVLITEELVNTSDLANIADHYQPLLKHKQWVAQVSHQVAEAARILHQHRFAHNDFKWRNIMVDVKADFPQIYLIDCPSGMKWYKPFLEFRIIKDLACLDKRAKYELSKKQRLAFYKDYAQCQKLSAQDKVRIRKILKFFHNRE